MKHNLLPEFQSAYRRGHSTETALLKITSDIFEAADNKQTTLLGMLDLSAAFDTVDHDILLTRLEKTYGITGSALGWITSFVSNRSQVVKFDGSPSASIRVRYGVPQGSVLGPLLYILYTADVMAIAAALGVRVHSYADDTQLYLTCPAVDQSGAVAKLVDCINKIEEWMTTNRLKLNADKTQFTWLGSRQQLTKLSGDPIQLHSSTIKLSSQAKNLGIILDAKMTM